MTGARIRLARDLREMSQTELAAKAGMSPASLCRCERDDRPPKPDELDRIAAALAFPPSFFQSTCRVYGPTGDVYFRKKSTALAGQQRRAVAELNLASLLAAEMDEMATPETPFGLTAGRLADFQESPVFAANAVRRELRLPPGPIRSLTATVEGAGVHVFAFDMGEHVMGLSHWPPHRPAVVCINGAMPGDRYRWTLAHEVGHLAMHTQEADPDTLEHEANAFAAELLMPRDDIYASLRGLTVSKMRALKHEWGVSMQALVSRAYELGLMSDHERSRHYMAFSKRGWRTREPEHLQAEQTSLVPELRRRLAARFDGTSGLAAAVRFPEDVLARLTSVSSGPMKSHLRYVPGGTTPQEPSVGS